MKNLLIKEIKLSASLLTYFFILFSIMAFIPGYPILVGAFFVCFGIFQSYQAGRENNDILYTVLLPVEKTDAVEAKFIFSVFIQMVSFALFLIFTLIRMILLKEAGPYVNNAMMNANQVFLAYVLIIFALFNWVFIKGYFKTAYTFGKPFIKFIVYGFIVITIAEAMHHFPNLGFLNATDTIGDVRLWIMLIVAFVIYVVVTLLSCRKSKTLFDKVDM